MILATHALTGAVIGKYVSNTWLVILFSIIIHFIMDTFRHGEYVESFDSKVAFKNTWWKISLDLSIAVILIMSLIYFEGLSRSEIRNVLLGSFFSMFPDLLTLLFWKFRLKFLAPIYNFHSWVHRYPRFSPERKWTLRNAVNDIIISIIAIVLLFL